MNNLKSCGYRVTASVFPVIINVINYKDDTNDVFFLLSLHIFAAQFSSNLFLVCCVNPVSCAGILEQFMGARNRVPARQATEAGGIDLLESILVLHKSLKYRLWIHKLSRLYKFMRLHCIQSVSCLCPDYLIPVFCLSLVRILPVSWLYPECLLPVFCLPLACILPVSYLYPCLPLACNVLVSWLYPACLLAVFCLSLNCFLLVSETAMYFARLISIQFFLRLQCIPSLQRTFCIKGNLQRALYPAYH